MAENDESTSPPQGEETPPGDAQGGAARPQGEAPAPAPGGDPSDDEPGEAEDSDFGPPFAAKTFGGAFVWARGDAYVATVLRVREGNNVVVSTRGRRDMKVMLTGGRAVLEVDQDGDIDRVELMPASPVDIDPSASYRLIALSEVELFTIYSPLA